MFDSIKSLAAKLPSIKTVGIVAGAAVAVVGVLALGCVTQAVQSDIGHEIIDLF